MMRAGLVNVPRLVDNLGAIGVVEGETLLPFVVRRFYFVHDVVPGATRGSHAHRRLEQLLLAVSGSLTVRLDDGRTGAEEFHLDGPTVGLHVPAGYWRTLTDFAPGTVLAVLASEEYDEADYFRDYSEFRKWSEPDG